MSITGTIKTYENNSMSLSCRGEIVVIDGIVIDKTFCGMPRVNGDSWCDYYKHCKIGNIVTDHDLKYLLSFNNKYNVKSIFKENG